MKQILAVGFQGIESSMIEWRQRVNNDYGKQTNSEMGLNSD